MSSLNPRKLIIAAVVLAVLGLAGAWLARLAQLLTAHEQAGTTIEYAQGSLFNGSAMVSISHRWQPIWTELSWHWCPQLNPLGWCVRFNGNVASGHGRVSLGLSSLSLHNVNFTANHLKLVLAGFIAVDASIEGQITRATLQQAEQLAAIDELDAVMIVSEIKATGLRFQNHRLSARRTAADTLELHIEGTQVNGTASSTNSGSYRTDIRLTPPASLAQLLANRLPQNADGSYQFSEQGRLPVLM